MVRGIALTGPGCPPPKIRVQAQAAWLERIEIGTRSQSMAFRPDVGDIHQSGAENGPPQLPLETKGPAFRVRVAEILLERAVLRIQKAGLARSSVRKLRKPVGITPPRRQRELVDRDGIWRCGGEVPFDDVRKQHR